MLDRGHLDLNFVHNFRDSLQESLKQTMLSQEVIFSRQVFELHQLYKVQRAMMMDFKQKDLDNYNLHKQGMSPVPVNLNNQLKCSMVEFMQTENFHLHYELQQQSSVFMRKPLDLQLSADEFIRQCVDIFSGNGVSSNSFQDKVVLDQDCLNLSLGIGQDASKKDGGHRYSKGRKTCSTSFGFIDLEDPNLSFSNHEADLGLTSGFTAPNSCSKDEHKLDICLKSGKQKLQSLPQSGISNGFYGTKLSRSHFGANSSSQTQPLFDSGSDEPHQKLLAANLLNANKQLPTCKVYNTVQPENPSYSSHNHPVVVSSSLDSSSSVLEKVYLKFNVASSVSPASFKEANVNQLTEMHETDRQKDLKIEDNQGEECSMDGKFRKDYGAHISFVDLDSDTSEELHVSRSGSKISSVGSSSKILNGLSCEMDLVDAVVKEANLGRGVEPKRKPHCCKSSSSFESECMITHQLNSIKTVQSGVKCDDINFTISDEGEKINNGPLAAHSGEQDPRSPDTTESEVDGTDKIAAELLVQMSSRIGACSPGEMTKLPLKRSQNEEDDQPQCSVDSYEAMVLKAEECSPDDYCVSSNAFLFDESEKKDIRYKLKRGTRMKDFQRDILPGLSTLSRQDIREDINILEGVIRSREYKKMRAKMMGDGGDDWCRSTRSKRSRVSRRYYS